MNPLWLKIGAGSLAIFGVGMAGITAAKKGAHELKTVASGSVRHALQNVPGKFLVFRLDGERLGRLRSIDLNADGDLTSESVQMVIGLDDPAKADRLTDCNLATENIRHDADEVDFHCVSEADMHDDRLTQIGEVRFQPTDLVRPLLIPERDRRRLEHSDLKRFRANLTAEDDRSVKGSADYDFTDHRGDHQRGSVRLDANDGKALIEIRDENGRELFHLRADDHGVSINATDRRGRELMRLLAGEAGVHMDVKGEREEK